MGQGVRHFTGEVTFLDSGREPQCPPDPRYPHGRDMDGAGAALACTVQLPYPAPRCGAMLAVCGRCGIRFAVTVGGRPDDPRSLRIPCRIGSA